jgi:hypothetical protein
MPKMYGSHQKVLLYIANKVDSILELGSGDFSTVQLHGLGKRMTTFDNNQEWISKYLHLKNYLHDFVCSDAKTFYEGDNTKWGLVFIDNGSWEDRIAAVGKYKDTADYVIFHDSDVISNQEMIEKYLENKSLKALVWKDIFKYFKEFHLIDFIEMSPYTLLASNKIDVTGILIEGMI